MVRKIIIEDIGDLNPSMAGYAVMLSTTHPDVEFKPGKQKPVESYLWYNFQLLHQPYTFTDYYAIKLGITDVNVAMREIDKWNRSLGNRKILTRPFDKIIDLGETKFGVLHIGDRSIVMMNRIINYPGMKVVHSGAGGYPWQYLDPLSSPSDTELKRYFNLSSTQRRSFRNQW